MRDVARWGAAPAENVDTASSSRVHVLRGLVARETAPLLSDDYLKLLTPLWLVRELRGVVARPGGRIQTCISAAAGDCTITI